MELKADLDEIERVELSNRRLQRRSAKLLTPIVAVKVETLLKAERKERS